MVMGWSARVANQRHAPNGVLLPLAKCPIPLPAVNPNQTDKRSSFKDTRCPKKQDEQAHRETDNAPPQHDTELRWNSPQKNQNDLENV
jgi:hypothetical protein